MRGQSQHEASETKDVSGNASSDLSVAQDNEWTGEQKRVLKKIYKLTACTSTKDDQFSSKHLSESQAKVREVIDFEPPLACT